MAIKKNDGATTTPDAGAPGVIVPGINEDQPQRGGSYVRNPDGSLLQTEGPDVAATNKQTSQE